MVTALPIYRVSKRKCILYVYADNEAPDQTAHAQSDQVLRCPLSDRLDTEGYVDVRIAASGCVALLVGLGF